MKFEEDEPLANKVERQGGEDILYINYKNVPFSPTFDYPEVMDKTIDAIIENPSVTRIVFVQQKNYNYDSKETEYLREIADLYVYFIKQEKILSYQKLITNNEQSFSKRYNDLFNFLVTLKKDPISSYSNIKSMIINEKILLKKTPQNYQRDQENYINLLEKIKSHLEKTKLIKETQKYLQNYQRGDRNIYHFIFKPDIIPNFTFTRLVQDLPEDVEIIDQYEISEKDYDKTEVTILKKKNESTTIYHMDPPENSLSEEYEELMNLARGVLIEHQPKAEEFTDTDRIRQVFFNIAKDLLKDLAQNKNISIDYNDINTLATILVRHTIGFGLIEVLLQDPNLQDIVLNAPISGNPIFVRHQEFDECSSNIRPSKEDADSWAAKFRMISGRPLDEANPILDTQLDINKMRARISIIQKPLSPNGLAYAIRRHRESPWTLPLFIKNKSINSFAAGLLSFLVDGSRTMLVAGTRSSGKSSLLGSLMLEIMRKFRVIVIEDTLELPVDSLRELRYDILRMKVRSALSHSSSEVSADDGIRTSLRLGDSCLIIGEVRSSEAKALYEAMRIGALANVVAGTIHGASPYAVFDRVVNDLQVPATSFKATDIIVVANVVKSPDGLESNRRVVRISEVRKHWKKDPLEEGGFVDLMKYNVETDELEPTEELINGDSEVIKDIASNVKGWAGNWDAVYDNILLRGEIKKYLVEAAEKFKKPIILEADFTKKSNEYFHLISEKIKKQYGLPWKKYVLPEWKKTINSEIKKNYS